MAFVVELNLIAYSKNLQYLQSHIYKKFKFLSKIRGQFLLLISFLQRCSLRQDKIHDLHPDLNINFGMFARPDG